MNDANAFPVHPVYEKPNNDWSDDHMNTGGDEYQEWMTSTGLNNGVVDSHNTYVSNGLNTTTGASKRSVIDHAVFINPRHGLNRENHKKHKVHSGARTETSEHNDSIDNGADFRWSTTE
jgi:hypothetical protein